MVFSEGGNRQVIIPSVVAFIAVPIAFTAYSLLLGGSTGGDGYSIDASRIQIALALLALGELGVISVVGWQWQLRLTSLAGGALLLILPILFGIIPGESKAATGYLLLGHVVILFVAGLEATIRYSEPIESVLRSDIGLYGIAVGVLHVLLAIGLETIARGTSGIYPSILIAGLVSVCILFVISVSAVILWAHEDLYSPVMLLLLWFTIGAYETFTLFLSQGSLTASTGIDWSRFSPTPDYLFSVSVLLVLFVFVIGVELTSRILLTFTQLRTPPAE
jgi:hypothetical protein